jgi:hypothetical protein
MSNFLSTIRAYLNFAIGIRHFLKNPTTLEKAKAIVREQVAKREDNFLQVLRQNVFNYPQSPYIPLFKRANISYKDVKQWVFEHGLESTLERLYDAGVYITYEEAKGHRPIVRGDLVIPVSATDFDSPDLNPILFGQSSGSTGIPTRNKMDLQHLAYQAKYMMIGFEMHGILNIPTSVWRGLLPDPSGITNILRFAHMGIRIDRWFSPVRVGEANLSRFYAIMTYLIVLMARLHGFRFPFPTFVTLEDPLPIATWAVESVRKEGKCVIRISVSKAVRISLSAQQHGLDLSGVVFHGAGEPPTSTKVETILASGAQYISRYAFSEAGSVGIACGNPKSIDDVHFMSNHMALIQRPVTVFDQTVNALCLTTLFPYAPKTLINVQSDDFGDVEERDCGCLLHQLGITTHLSGIRSYHKLTSEGMTLIGSDMVYIIEKVLPTQFGGNSLDYQLVEEENDVGMSKLVLYVNPSIEIQDENDLSLAFLNAMRESTVGTRLAEAEYRYGNVIEIRRQKPILTSRDKYFPIHTLFKQQK